MRDVSLVIFTDLDGSLLDHHTYSVEEAGPGLEAARRARVPVVLCSSKTRAEIAVLQRDLSMRWPSLDEYGDLLFHPIISENGGALFIARGYFTRPPLTASRAGVFDVVPFGRPYPQVVASLHQVAAEVGVPIVGFSDMSVAQVAHECGCSLEQARLAKCREYDEPFRIVSGTAAARTQLVEALGRVGLQCTRGARFEHAMGPTDKGRVAAYLKRMYEDESRRRVVTIGLGDSVNDAPLLASVDIPVIVRNSPADVVRLQQRVPQAYVTQRRGPAGWSHAVCQLVGAFTERHCEVAL